MNRYHWMSLLSVALLVPVSQLRAADTGTAAYAALKIYAVAVSPNTDCSNARLVYTNASPSYQDMTQTPTLADSVIPNGTYQCVMLKMSDQFIARPAFTSDSGNCTPSTTLHLDIARGDPTKDPITGVVTTTAVGEDLVWLYLSTTGGSADAPWIPANALHLGSPWVVSDDRVGTFVADFSGAVEDQFPIHGSNSCDCGAPAFSFR